MTHDKNESFPPDQPYMVIELNIAIATRALTELSYLFRNLDAQFFYCFDVSLDRKNLNFVANVGMQYEKFKLNYQTMTYEVSSRY